MTIERISKIKQYRIFKDFIWPKNLSDFKEKNLIYGWNGSGKTTISSLFRLIEKKEPIENGEVEFVISGKKIDGKKLSTFENLPIRVFNRDFIEENVFTSDSSVSPIFFVGESGIKKQKEVEALTKTMKKKLNECKDIEEKIKRIERELDEFTKEHAKSIKALLSSPDSSNHYNNYDKRTYKSKCDELLLLTDDEQKAKILSESDFNKQKNRKDLNQLEKIQLLKLKFPNTRKLTREVVNLLKKTFYLKFDNSLEDDPELLDWVKTGLDLHKKNLVVFVFFVIIGHRDKAYI